MADTDGPGSPRAKRQRCDAARVPRRPLGSSGLDVSCIGLGCFAFAGDHVTGAHLGEGMAKLHGGVWGAQDEADSHAAIKAALDAGINFFDNAEMYGNGYAEEVLGRGLRASGYERSEYVIATKVCETFLDPASLREHLEASLKRLNTDYIDLYQIHWHSRAALKSTKYPERPLAEEVPLETTLRALNECRRDGLIRHIGVCNFGPEDLKAALETGVPVVSNQVCYNLLWRGIEHELVDVCEQHNVALLPWSPMAQGLLTGKFATADDVPAGRQRTRLFSSARPQQRHGEAGLEQETFEVIDKVRGIAEQGTIPMAQLSLAWVMAQRGITSCLMGARDAKQVVQNLECLKVSLEELTMEELDQVTRGLRDALGKNMDPYENAAHSRIR